MQDHQHLLLVFVAITAVLLCIWIFVRAIRWAKKGTKAASMLAAAAFPFPDQPPPHELIAEANRLGKDAESGDPELPKSS